MNVIKKENLIIISKYLTENLNTVLKNLSDEQTDSLCEIRIREEQPVMLRFVSTYRFVTCGGRLTQFYSENLLRMRKNEIEKIFSKMCRFSVYSLTESIVNGFITLEGGNRVGVYGTAVSEDGRINSVRNISGLNIRLSGDRKDISRPVVDRFFENSVSNLLVCGPPSSGKTTLLRDLCRILSDEKLKRIAVIDERGEMYGYNLGFNTDVLNRYPKARGIEIAVRTLSPEIIVCDEVGGVDETSAIKNSLNSGVKFVMSIHCNSIDELKHKEQFKIICCSGAVENLVFLDKDFNIEMRRIDEDYIACTAGNGMRTDRAVHSLCT